jgi:non-ribosomal peptide synthetase component F
MQREYALTPDDRVAETADLSFDISVSNMFVTWNAGASLHILNAAAMFSLVKFVRRHELTVWYSVPSVIPLLQKTKALTPACMPSLRLTFFAGEPLPVAAAEAWRAAAPNSRVENLYGPTEATVVCLRQRVETSVRATAERGIVAIGKPFQGARVAILDENLRFAKPGEKGEIALAGPQLSAGYWGRPDLTALRFPTLDGERWYLTGDFGVEDGDGVFHHLGRIDNQVKVRGNRVELEEIEEHLRRLGMTNDAAAVAWPIEHGSASGIVGFVAGAKATCEKLAQDLRLALPSYMAPSAIIELERLPLNDNGKIDRKALTHLLETARA